MVSDEIRQRRLTTRARAMLTARDSAHTASSPDGPAISAGHTANCGRPSSPTVGQAGFRKR